MSVVSVNGPINSYFALPLVLIPFFALFASPLSTDRVRDLAVRGLVFLMLGVLCAGAAINNQLGRYEDCAPRECNAEFTEVPLKGIWTMKERAEVFDTLAKLVEGREYVLAYDLSPGVFVYSKARSAVDTIQVTSEQSETNNRRSILHMGNERRFPQLIIESHRHPWHWGTEAGKYPWRARDDAFAKFTRCARGKQLFESRDFSAWEVLSDKAPSCVQEALK